jgi:hypothetical protein
MTPSFSYLADDNAPHEKLSRSSLHTSRKSVCYIVRLSGLGMEIRRLGVSQYKREDVQILLRKLK